MNDIYELLNITSDYVENVRANQKDFYLSYKKNKRKGFRWIDVPSVELRAVQRNILDHVFSLCPVFNKILKSNYAGHPENTRVYITGFVKNGGPVINALLHKNSAKLLTIDLHDFFGSIKANYPLFLLKLATYFAEKLNKKYYMFKTPVTVEQLKTILYTFCFFYGQLPQGAPTSPFLANWFFLPCDYKLAQFSNKLGLTYSRYADDITVSSQNPEFDFEEYKFLMFNIIKTCFNGTLSVNLSKTRILAGNFKIVTGISIKNGALMATREYRRNLRAAIHNHNKNPTPQSWVEVKAKLAWVTQINRVMAARLERTLVQVN